MTKPEELAALYSDNEIEIAALETENLSTAQELCEMAGLADEFEAAGTAAECDTLVCEAAKKLHVYDILCGRKEEATA